MKGGGGPERMGNLQRRVWLGEQLVTFSVVHFGCVLLIVGHAEIYRSGGAMEAQEGVNWVLMVRDDCV